jgi:hypothetical protein
MLLPCYFWVKIKLKALNLRVEDIKLVISLLGFQVWVEQEIEETNCIPDMGIAGTEMKKILKLKTVFEAYTDFFFLLKND